MQHDRLDLTRRGFLVRAALASSAAAFWPARELPSLGAGTFSPPMTVFSKVYQELKLDFQAAAEVTAAAGLDGVDSPVRPGGEITPERAKDDMPRYDEALRKRGARLRLLTTAITSPASPFAEEILRTAKKLGIQYYRLGQWYHQPQTPLAKQLTDLKAQLKDLAALNRDLGLCAIFQNHSPAGRTYFGGDLPELIEIVKDFNPDQIGVAFDLGHALVVNGDEWRVHFEKLKSHLKVAYLKDVKRPRSFVPFGQGEFGRSGYFKLLKQMDYQAPFSIHIEFNWAGPGNQKTQTALVKALQDCRQAVQRWVAEA
jgi:sugar phosphate isomerase/epimerase